MSFTDKYVILTESNILNRSFTKNPRLKLKTMSENYDTFSYDGHEDDGLYEPVLDSNFPPVPPRRQPPPVPVPQEPESNYEDLNEVKELPPIPRLPPRNTPSFRKERNFPSFCNVSERNKSALPEMPQRGPPPIPDGALRAPPPILNEEMNYEDINNYDARKPLPLPENPPPRPPVPIPDNGEAPELNYEELNDFDERPLPLAPAIPIQRNLPSVPDTQPWKAPLCPPQHGFERPTKRNIPDESRTSDVNTDILDKIRRNLKKTNINPQKESPKSQFPAQLEVVVKPKLPHKPKLHAKPVIGQMPNKINSTLTGKMNTLNLDSTDGRQENEFKLGHKAEATSGDHQRTYTAMSVSKMLTVLDHLMINETQTPERKSPINTFNRKNSTPQIVEVPPLRSELLAKNTEEVSAEEVFDSLEEYADAAELKSLHYRLYYYESFTRSQEKQMFNEDTEDGTFVIRKSRGKDNNHPYTILVYYKSRAYRLKIRLEDDMYAIGEKKDDENKFPSVIELVDHYETTPLMLIGAGSTKLKCPSEKF